MATEAMSIRALARKLEKDYGVPSEVIEEILIEFVRSLYESATGESPTRGNRPERDEDDDDDPLSLA